MVASSTLLDYERHEIFYYAKKDKGTIPRHYRNMTPIPYTNVLLLGKPGSGKTKFLQSLAKSLHGSHSPIPSHSGSSNQHQTTKIRYLKLGNANTGNKPDNIRIVETFGYQDTVPSNEAPNLSDYPQGLFMMLLKGEIPDDFSMYGQLPLHPVRKQENTIHAIIFTVDLPSVDSADFSKLIVFRQLALQFNIDPIVVLTKVDIVNKNIEKHPELMDTCPQIAAKIDQFIEKTGFERDQIYTMKNFQRDEEDTLFIQEKILKIFIRALDKAESYFEVLHDSKTAADNDATIQLNARFIF